MRNLIALALCSVFFFSLSKPAQANEVRGKQLFKLCVSCHGEQGEGRQNLAAPSIAGLPEWYIEAQLIKFRTGVRGLHPNDIPGMRMRPMARTIPNDDDVKSIAKHVSSLPRPKLSPSISGDVAKGQAAFAVCSACHGPDAKGMQALNAPPLAGASGWYLLTQLHNFKAGIRGANPAIDATGSTMRPMASMLDDQGMRDVVAYIESLNP